MENDLRVPVANALENPNERRSSMPTVLAASMIGTIVEWYDYLIYGTAAALVFNKLFFPSLDPTVGTIAAFGAFAVGAISRPLGGVIFGHLVIAWAENRCS